MNTIRLRTLILIGLLLALVAAGCNGLPGGIGIPPEPTQALIDGVKVNLSVDDANGTQILFKYYHEFLTDGVHNVSGKFKLPSGKSVQGGTCPILVYNPQRLAHESGELSDADWASFVMQFLRAKMKQDLVGKRDKAQADLVAAGLPYWYGGQPKPPAPTPVAPSTPPAVPNPVTPTPAATSPPVTPPAVPAVPSKDALMDTIKGMLEAYLKAKGKK